MLSRTGLYALRSVVALVTTRDTWISAADLAERLELPANYLSKTLHRLAHAGILESRRGPHGGFRLAREPDDLSVADVVDHFERVRGASQCLMYPRACDAADPCPAHREWSSWIDSRLGVWERTSIADLLGNGEAARETLALDPLAQQDEDGP